MQHRLYCEIVKIETPEASVSGVFNLWRFSPFAAPAFRQPMLHI